MERVLLLSGKLYYDLVKERAQRGLNNKVAIIRIEEISPFPYQLLVEVLRKYSGSHSEVFWVQEEPRNQGAWPHVYPRISSVLKEVQGSNVKGSVDRIHYVGRKEDAVPAVGVGKIFRQQQAMLLDSAFNGL